MRLKNFEQDAIREAVYLRDADARIFLFGSRADDTKKGGDIDLLIFSDKLTQDDVSPIRRAIWNKIGEQKIDIILTKDDSQPFVRIALSQGVKL